MKTLALDTSTRFLTISCLEGEKILSSLHEEAGISHSEIIVARISNVIEEAGWKLSDIGLIALGIGPGSFTGLRIGTAVVKGFALVYPMKIIGVPTLDAIAMRAPEGDDLIVPVLDAHKGKVYSCVYERKDNGTPERKTDYLLCEVNALEQHVKSEAVYFGNGLGKYADKLEQLPGARLESGVDWYPRAYDIGKIGVDLSVHRQDTPAGIEPMYLYPKECNILNVKNK